MYTNALFTTLRFLNSKETSHNNKNTKVSTTVWLLAAVLAVSVAVSPSELISSPFMWLSALALMLTDRLGLRADSVRDSFYVLALSSFYVLIHGYGVFQNHFLMDLSIYACLAKICYDKVYFIHLVSVRVSEKSAPGYQLELAF